jgi:hypothetical protein
MVKLAGKMRSLTGSTNDERTSLRNSRYPDGEETLCRLLSKAKYPRKIQYLFRPQKTKTPKQIQTTSVLKTRGIMKRTSRAPTSYIFYLLKPAFMPLTGLPLHTNAPSCSTRFPNPYVSPPGTAQTECSRHRCLYTRFSGFWG